MKSFFAMLLALAVAFSAVAEAKKGRTTRKQTSNKTKKENIIRSEAGLNIPDWGISIDALFDPRLDDLVPGYHIVNLVISNRRGDPIKLNTKSDKWYIVDSQGKRHKAYNHVKHINRKAWSRMPRKLKEMIDYPDQVSPGKSISVDVFVPKSVDLFQFKEVIWDSKHFDKEFSVFTNYEKTLAIDDVYNKEFSTPQSLQQDQVFIPRKYAIPGQENQSGYQQNKPQEKPAPAFDPSLDDAIIIR